MAVIWPILERIKSPLTITCRRCGHVAVWPRDKAIVNLGGSTM